MNEKTTKDQTTTEDPYEALQFRDISIPEKTWKEYRKQASQEELFTIGVGAKYRLATSRALAFIGAVGIVISIAVGLAELQNMGLLILIGGYLLFSFICTKWMRYDTTLSQVMRRLDAESRDKLKNLLKTKPIWKIVDALLKLVIVYMTIPYQMVMLVLDTFLPNVAVANNGILLTVPVGYGFEDLMAVSDYYKQVNFFDELNNYVQTRSHRYEKKIINDMGCEETVHSSDGVNFYDNNGNAYKNTKMSDGFSYQLVKEGVAPTAGSVGTLTNADDVASAYKTGDQYVRGADGDYHPQD